MFLGVVGANELINGSIQVKQLSLLLLVNNISNGYQFDVR